MMMTDSYSKGSYLIMLVSLLMLGLFIPVNNLLANDSNEKQVSESAAVILDFTAQEYEKKTSLDIEDKDKQIIMFSMGVSLLILVITTACLGVAMGVYGKAVFVPHMLTAGLTVTLAIVHSIVAIVWFYPF